MYSLNYLIYFLVKFLDASSTIQMVDLIPYTPIMFGAHSHILSMKSSVIFLVAWEPFQKVISHSVL